MKKVQSSPVMIRLVPVCSKNNYFYGLCQSDDHFQSTVQLGYCDSDITVCLLFWIKSGMISFPISGTGIILVLGRNL